MSVSEFSTQDGVSFARSIRSLARETRDLLRGSADCQEIQDLLDRIDRLEVVARTRQTEDLVRWLGSLRRVVEEQVMAAL
jgi:predicted membrane chloride channel (bestrophin family)